MSCEQQTFIHGVYAPMSIEDIDNMIHELPIEIIIEDKQDLIDNFQNTLSLVICKKVNIEELKEDLQKLDYYKIQNPNNQKNLTLAILFGRDDLVEFLLTYTNVNVSINEFEMAITGGTNRYLEWMGNEDFLENILNLLYNKFPKTYEFPSRFLKEKLENRIKSFSTHFQDEIKFKEIYKTCRNHKIFQEN